MARNPKVATNAVASNLANRKRAAMAARKIAVAMAIRASVALMTSFARMRAPAMGTICINGLQGNLLLAVHWPRPVTDPPKEIPLRAGFKTAACTSRCFVWYHKGMKYFIFASVLASVFCMLVSCSPPSSSGTGDSQLDAEIRTLQYHEEQIVYYGRIVDSLGCITSRSPEQEDALRQAIAQQDQHQAQWQEAHQRANERAQGDWQRICPLKRSPGMSCND
jgi:hypothetical protein